MKKVLIVMVIGFLGFNAQAQFGVKAGLGVSSWTLKDRNTNAGQELFNAGFAFHTGFGYEIELGDNVSLEPGLLYSQKTFSIESTNATNFTKIKTSFVEMPVNVKVYVVDLGDAARLYAIGGGYVAYMLSAKSNGNKLNIGNKSSDIYKTLDGGLNIGAGVKLFDSLNIDFSGGIGITNLSSDQSNGLVSKLNVVRLTVTYQIGG
ncbi:PorT family protein [Aurantibacter crassamenti]|uniref:porin family protein n=1 Tax=Aurantibacter crassamenti TaxID=1837375 RepID=UPI001939B5EC|nr:porin family protein [Aurantibacter crassamenti]MBM1105596.1 PorT family protein [Aurantibacter crassamenti]